MDESLTTPHCPVCEEEVTDRKVYFRVKPQEPTLTAAQVSGAESISHDEEEMVLLNCGHAFRQDDFSDFWTNLRRWQSLYQSHELVSRHPKGTPEGRKALHQEMGEVETLIGRAADSCRENVVSEPEVSLP